MTELTGSWKKHVDYKYLSGEDFNDQTVELTIKKVVKEEAYNPKTRKNEPVVVLYFEGTDKGIILNLTNSRAIDNIMSTDIVENWIGKKVPFWGQPDKRHGRVVRVKKDFSKVKM